MKDCRHRLDGLAGNFLVPRSCCYNRYDHLAAEVVLCCRRNYRSLDFCHVDILDRDRQENGIDACRGVASAVVQCQQDRQFG